MKMSFPDIESPADQFDASRSVRLQRGARRHRHHGPLPAPVRRRPRPQDVDVRRGGIVPQVNREEREWRSIQSNQLNSEIRVKIHFMHGCG